MSKPLKAKCKKKINNFDLAPKTAQKTKLIFAYSQFSKEKVSIKKIHTYLKCLYVFWIESQNKL